ncbi:hypothetical protein A3863_07905 [Priestia endophytica]|uniref:MerR family transcriptional regulator n=1 Tax=Priestia endophytica TaxID=135735 RepID=UPI000DCA8FB2|nr:MerR family transcriptional regulator [Priestia endophytica]RAS90777.1 hypothetical protein A3863_07870 [Priestia endophytica]RAS90784.1 hypothetical protein A3863_07905 [Priestia endophytica]
MTQTQEEKLYTPKQAAQHLEITEDVLKKWARDFNIQTERTSGGHRRYSKTNIEELMGIKEKIREQNWSMKQVQQWRNGEEEVFVSHEEKSVLENKMDKLLQQREEDQELLKQTLQAMIRLEQEVLKTNQKVTLLEQEIAERDQLIAEREKTRDKQFIEEVKSTLEEKKPQKRKGIFSRLFG